MDGGTRVSVRARSVDPLQALKRMYRMSISCGDSGAQSGSRLKVKHVKGQKVRDTISTTSYPAG